MQRSEVEAKQPGAWVKTTVRFVDLLVGVLVAPRATFKALTSEQAKSTTGMAAAIVVSAAALDGLRFGAQSGSGISLFANVILSVYMGLVLWLLMVSIPAILARFFGLPRESVLAFAATSGCSFLPWVFMPALSLWESTLGATAVLLFAATLLAWMAYLLWVSVSESFSVSGKQTLCLLLILPQLVILVVFAWTWQVVNEIMSLLGF